MPRTLLLVDLTNIAVRCSLGGPVPPDVAARTACGMIARVADQVGATHLVCAADHPAPSWRRQFAPDYKAGRSLDTTPYTAAAVDAARARGWVTLDAAGWEADDVIATVAERAVAIADVMCYSGDADLEALVRRGTDLHGSVHVVWPRPGGAWALHDADVVCARHGIADPAQLPDLKAIAGEPGDNVAGLAGRTPSGAVATRPALARRLLARYQTLDGVLAAGQAHDSREARECYLARERLLHARTLVTVRSDAPVPELRLSACALRPSAVPPRRPEAAHA